MRIYSLIMVILILLFTSCIITSDEKEKKRYERNQNFQFLYFVFYLPAEAAKARERKNCDQPNAIFTEFGQIGAPSGCFTNKVSQGFIYDASTNQAIISDTASAGQSFLCKCSTVTYFNPFLWERGAVIDNPPIGVSTSKIFYSYDSGHTNNDALVYKTHYNQPDNLYCIPGNCGFSEYKYQFLKIR